MENKLFTPVQLGAMTLKNRMVMAPMTRNRATADNIPVELMAEYYAQRANAGLIITEGTSPSPNGVGYAFIPGIYNDAQVAGWTKVTNAVHAKGGHTRCCQRCRTFWLFGCIIVVLLDHFSS